MEFIKNIIKLTKRFINNIWDKLQNNPILTTILLFLFLFPLVYLYTVILGGGYNKDFWKNFSVELNSVIFELIVIVVIVMWITKINEKINYIRRLKEEIDDFRHWKSDEAKFRITGNVKRLNGLNISAIDLSSCFLDKTNLSRSNLQKASLYNSNLQGANLQWINLSRSNLSEANLQGANLQWANLERANLSEANLEGANLSKANLKGAVLQWANIQFTDLTNANLQGADLMMANIAGSNFLGTNLLEVKIGNIKSFLEVHNINAARMSDELIKEIKNTYPLLLD